MGCAKSYQSNDVQERCRDLAEIFQNSVPFQVSYPQKRDKKAQEASPRSRVSGKALGEAAWYVIGQTDKQCLYYPFQCQKENTISFVRKDFFALIASASVLLLLAELLRSSSRKVSDGQWNHGLYYMWPSRDLDKGCSEYDT